MTRIGFLIPEFPGQTQSFFMREKQELASLGVMVELLSTRRPVEGAGAAKHAWAADAAKNTTYLFPLSLPEIALCLITVVVAGPSAWVRCLGVIFGRSDVSARERIKLLGLLLSGAQLKRLTRAKGLQHVHVHSCANAANTALFAKLLGGPRYSMTLHGAMQTYGSNQANKWRHATFVIIVTEVLREEAKAHLAGTPLPPLYVAPMGVDVNTFKRSQDYLPPAPGETLRLVSTGRINYAKAHDDLVRVVALLKQRGIPSRLHILGSTDSQSEFSGYEAELKKLVSDLDVDAEVSFLGSVAEHQVKHELETAHLFCLASLQEGLSVAVMEAMALGAPVIVTRLPAIHELIEEGVDGLFVDTRAPEQFVEAIADLIAHPEQAAKLSANGRRKIAQNFHAGVSAKAIADGLQHNLKQ